MDINLLVRSLEAFADIDPEIQLPAVMTLLFVAQRGQCSQKDVEENLGMSNSSASRNVSYWTERRFDRKPGVGFIRRQEDDHDRRTKVLSLTPTGEAFLERLRRL